MLITSWLELLQRRLFRQHFFRRQFHLRRRRRVGHYGVQQLEVRQLLSGTSPTDIQLSSDVIAENSPTFSVVGTLSATDADVGDTFTYSLVAGVGDTNNTSFTIDDQLKTTEVFDYETQSQYSIRIRVTDQEGLSFEKAFTIAVTDVNEAPSIIVSSTVPSPTPPGVNLFFAPDAQVSDADSPNFAGGELNVTLTATGSSGDQLFFQRSNGFTLSGTTVSYNGTQIGTWLAGTNTQLNFSLNSAATPAVVGSLIRQFYFRDNGNPVSYASRTVQITLNDGASGIGTAIQTIQFNQPPVVTVSSTVAGGTPGVNLYFAPDAQVTDSDSTNFTGGELAITLATPQSSGDQLFFNRSNGFTLTGTSVFYNGTQIGTLHSVTNSQLNFSLTSAATPNIVGLLLQRIYFRDNGTPVSYASRTVQITLDDGAGAIGSATQTLTFVPDPPVVTVSGTVAGGNPWVNLYLAPDAQVTDPDSTNFAGGQLAITLTNPQSSGDQLFYNRSNGFTLSGTDVSYNGTKIATWQVVSNAEMKFNLTSAATPNIVGLLLQRIYFRDNGTPASYVPRTVQITLNDGVGGIGSATQTLTFASDSPVVSVPAEFTAISPGINAYFAPNAQVTDQDSTNFAGGQLAITLTNPQSSGDQLFYNRSNGFTLSGTDVSYNGTKIATWQVVSNAEMKFNLTSAATPNIVGLLLQRIYFRDNGSPTSNTPRTIQITLNDGANGIGTATQTLNFDDNNAPLLNPVSMTVGSGGSSNVLPLAAAQDEDGDTLTLIGVNSPAHGSVQITTNAQGQPVLTYIPDPGFTGTETLTYIVEDALGHRSTEELTLDVVNHAPVAADDHYHVQTGTTLNASSTELTSPLPSVLVNDIDADDQSLIAVLVSAPAHGDFTLLPDGTFSYTPETGFLGQDSFTYQTFDGIDFGPVTTVVIDVREDGGAGVVPHFTGDAGGTYATDVGITVAAGTDEAFSIDPTSRFDPGTLIAEAGDVQTEDSLCNIPSSTTDENGIQSVSSTSVAYTREVEVITDPTNGSWSYTEELTTGYGVDSSNSDDSNSHVLGSYRYSFSAQGDATYTSYTFEAHTLIHSSGEFTQAWGDEEQSGSITYTWSQDDKTDLIITNTTSLITGLSVGSQTNSSESMLMYLGVGGYATSLPGGSLSGTINAGGMQSSSASLQSRYSNAQGSWLVAAFGTTTSLGNDDFHSRGEGDYSQSESTETSSTQNHGTVKEDSADVSVSSLMAMYELSATGWELTTGQGTSTASGGTNHSTKDDGSYAYAITGGSSSGTSKGDSSDSTHYSSNTSSSAMNGQWLTTGFASQGGNGNTSQSSDGEGHFLISDSTTQDGVTHSSTTIGNTDENSSSSTNYNFNSRFDLTGDEWVQTEGSSSAGGSTSNHSGYSSTNTYSTSDAKGSMGGENESSGTSDNRDSYTVDSTFENGQWTDSGTASSSGSGSETSQFSGSGTYTAARTLEDGTGINSSGDQTEEGNSNSIFSWSSGSVLLAGAWVQTTGTGLSTSSGTSQTSSEGSVTYNRALEGGQTSNSGDDEDNHESSSQNTSFNATVISNFTGGEWVDTGTRSDNSSFTNDSSYKGTGSTHVVVPVTNGQGSTTDTTIHEDGMQFSFGSSHTVSTLNATGAWEITSGSGESFTAGTSHNDTTSTGRYTQEAASGNISGATKGDSSQDTTFDFTIESNYTGGQWVDTGTRQDIIHQTSSSDSNSEGFSGNLDSTPDSYSATETDNDGNSYTVTGETKQDSHTSQSSERTIDSTLGPGEEGWKLSGGSGSSSNNSRTSYTSVGTTESTHVVEGGSTTGTTTITRVSRTTSNTDLTDTVTAGAWSTTGSGSDTSFQSRNISYEGSGSYSLNIEDENGGSTTQTGEVTSQTTQFESSDVATTSSGYSTLDPVTAETGFVWIQETGTATDKTTDSAQLTYTDSVTETGSVSLPQGTFSGTLSNSTITGSDSSSTVVSEYDPEEKVWAIDTGDAKSTLTLGYQTKITIDETISLDNTTGPLSAHQTSGYTNSQTETYTYDTTTAAWSSPTLSETGQITGHTDWNYEGSNFYTDGITGVTRGINSTGNSDVNLNLQYTGTGENRTATGSGTATSQSHKEMTNLQTSPLQRELYVRPDGSGTDYATGSSSMFTSDTVDNTVSLNYTLGNDSWSIASGTSTATQDSLSETRTQTDGTVSYSASLEADPEMGDVDYEGNTWYEKSYSQLDLVSHSQHTELNSTYAPSSEIEGESWTSTGTSTSQATGQSRLSIESSGGSNQSFTREIDGGEETWEYQSENSEETERTADESVQTDWVYANYAWTIQEQQQTRQASWESEILSHGQEESHEDWTRESSQSSTERIAPSDSSTTISGQSQFDRTIVEGGVWVPPQADDLTWSLSGEREALETWREVTTSISQDPNGTSWVYGSVSRGENASETLYEGSQDSLPGDAGTNHYHMVSGNWYDTVQGDSIELVEPDTYGTSGGGPNYQNPFPEQTSWMFSSALTSYTSLAILVHSPGYVSPSVNFSLPGSLFGSGDGGGGDDDGGSQWNGGDFENTSLAWWEGFFHGFFVTGPKAVVNSSVDTAVGFATLGTVDPPDLIAVDPMTDLGYDSARIAADVATNIALTAATANLSCASKIGQVAQALDTGGAAVGVGQAIGDIAQNGLTIANAASLIVNVTSVTAGTRFKECFPAGTLVSTEDGQRPIEDIQAGDRVWAYNLTAGEWALRPVRETYEFVSHDFVELRIDGKKIVSTAGHPFWVMSGEDLDDRPKPDHITAAEEELLGERSQLPGRWVDAEDLQPGDTLFLQDGRQVIIDSVQPFQDLQKTYNFAVDDLHCYTVGELCVLVHNGCGTVGRHGDMPTPRGGRESHHGVPSAWMQAHIPGYTAGNAPAVLLSSSAHNTTRATYNTWRAAMRQAMGGVFSWTNVSAADAFNLSELMFDAAGVPGATRLEYYRQLFSYLGDL